MKKHEIRVGDLVGFAEEERLIGVVTNVGTNICDVMDEIGRLSTYPKVVLEPKSMNIRCAVENLLDEVALFMSTYKKEGEKCS